MTKPPPAEWARHEAVWIGFPSHQGLWLNDLAPARNEVTAFARTVHAGGRGERVLLVAADEEAAIAAQLAAPFAEVIVYPFGDIWLRDTTAIIDGDGTGHIFRFNGWGQKYVMPGDETIGTWLAEACDRPVVHHDWVLEGGAIDGDGTGLVVLTEQCLLNPNRNPGATRDDIEARLAANLGFNRFLWLGEGLMNDHTDGHVDNLARFVGVNRLAIPVSADSCDPNYRVYNLAAQRAQGFGVEVARVPSPGLVLRNGQAIPASCMNFYIGNVAVVVPMYGTPNDDLAVQMFQLLFPDRTVVGLPANHVLSNGGGSFHCISQQIPA
ncbi:hypothetical protein RvY_11890 [Ramazzottius varieornatus]|uniref:Agmatine deiminase n=1 Tax=Ramazzottius varieornatus TaxID=947166 RepID=A0A1D1VLX0_RAMVA|nr:hypothetical protein RvY_11890 [Ramazzottius varieornatus]